jgi:hypothetical protein
MFGGYSRKVWAESFADVYLHAFVAARFSD